ncbi:MAG TPA: M81 family metallopeptidase [Bryobacteraceae bacterium]|nr:M81 family metallopeptidase [Bryobacteraceae bacterium]
MRLLLMLIATLAAPAQTIGIAMLMHESNSFNASLTQRSDFSVVAGSAPNWRPFFAAQKNEVTGFLDVIGKEPGIQVVQGMYAGATPKGPVARAAYESLVSELIASLKAGGKLDAILLALHGAMVAEHFPQADEETLRRVREAFPGIPIVVTHDFHANISPQTLNYCTALVVYQQTPHIDTRARGQRAANILVRTLRGEIKPVQSIIKPPMVFNILYHNTFAGVLHPITQDSIELEKSNPKILSASVLAGYQYADVPFMGPSVVVVADGDRNLAEREAKRLSDRLWAVREELKVNAPDAAAAVRNAMRAAKFPVALMDTGDNIGGGSSGDSTFLLEQLIAQKADGWVVVMYDPAAVDTALKAGIGGTFDMSVGGKTDKQHGKPVRVRGRVRSFDDGDYIETAVRHGGNTFYHMGLTAVIEAEGSTPTLKNYLVLTKKRSSPNSIHQIVHLGIYPERQKILVAKGTIAPRAAYEPVSAEIVLVDTPGATAVNPSRFTFQHVPKDLFGLHP